MERLKSRKFWAALITGGLIIANQGFELNLPEDSIQTVANLAMVYILGQGVVDVGKAVRR